MAKKSIEDKVLDKYPTFYDLVQPMSKQELESNLLLYAKKREQITAHKANLQELKDLKARQSKVAKPYNEMINALKKMNSCIHQFADRFDPELKKEMEGNLLTYEKQMQRIMAKKEECRELNAIKEMISEINSDYSDSIAEFKDKCAYLDYVLRERYGDEFEEEFDKIGQEESSEEAV